MLASASDQSSVDLGNNMVIVGLIIQAIFFGLFILACAIFHRRMLASGYTGTSTMGTVSWQQYMLVLYVASGLIAVRSIFRVAEYAGGQTGVLMESEVYLYVFDALLMLLLMLVFIWRHPSLILGKKAAAMYGLTPLA